MEEGRIQAIDTGMELENMTVPLGADGVILYLKKDMAGRSSQTSALIAAFSRFAACALCFLSIPLHDHQYNLC
jgi:hypothetical protein